MNIDKDYSFTTVNENGQEVICDTLSVINIEGEDPIIIYTDYSLDENKKFNLYVSKVVSQDNNFKLERIDETKILPEVQQQMEKIYNELQNEI